MVGQLSRDRATRADKEKAGPDRVGRMLRGGGWERLSPACLDRRLQGCKPCIGDQARPQTWEGGGLPGAGPWDWGVWAASGQGSRAQRIVPAAVEGLVPRGHGHGGGRVLSLWEDPSAECGRKESALA